MQARGVHFRSHSTVVPPTFEAPQARRSRRPPSMDEQWMLGLIDAGQNRRSTTCDTISNVYVEVSTHAGVCPDLDQEGVLNISDDRLHFVSVNDDDEDEDEDEEPYSPFGPCIGKGLLPSDIVSAQLLSLSEVKSKLEVQLTQSALTSRGNFQSISLTHTFPVSTPNAFHHQAALELALPKIWSFDSCFTSSHIVLCLQFLCRCPEVLDKECRRRRQRLSWRLRRARSEQFASHAFSCLLIPKEESLKLYRRLMAWMRLRSIEWRAFFDQLVHRNEESLSQTLHGSLMQFDASGDLGRRFSIMTEYTDEYTFPQLQVGVLPSDDEEIQKQTREVHDLLTPPLVRWFCRGRIPEHDALDLYWCLNYSTQRHGHSLKTLYDRMRKFRGDRTGYQSPCLLLIEDKKCRQFAALLSHVPHNELHCYGLPEENILYRLSSNFTDIEWFQCKPGYPNIVAGNRNMFSIGTTKGNIALNIFEDLMRASVEPCEAYDGLEKKSLTDSTQPETLSLTVLEVWSLHPAPMARV